MHDLPQNSVQLIHDVRVKSGKEFPQLSDFCQYANKHENHELFKLIVQTPESFFAQEGQFIELTKRLNSEFFSREKNEGKWVKMVGGSKAKIPKKRILKENAQKKQKAPQL